MIYLDRYNRSQLIRCPSSLPFCFFFSWRSPLPSPAAATVLQTRVLLAGVEINKTLLTLLDYAANMIGTNHAANAFWQENPKETPMLCLSWELIQKMVHLQDYFNLMISFDNTLVGWTVSSNCALLTSTSTVPTNYTNLMKDSKVGLFGKHQLSFAVVANTISKENDPFNKKF